MGCRDTHTRGAPGSCRLIFSCVWLLVAAWFAQLSYERVQRFQGLRERLLSSLHQNLTDGAKRVSLSAYDLLWQTHLNILCLIFHLSRCTVANSAACYDRGEDVGILPVVMTARELSQVQRQIGLADVVIGAHHATLQQAMEAIQVGRVTLPPR